MKLLDYYRKLRDEYLRHKRKKYFSELKKIFKPSTSIISSNCFAGRIMQDLQYEYNSPTLGLYFFADDYIRFLQNLRHNLLEAELTFYDESKYPLGNQRRANWKHWYPIGRLDGEIEIHFLHYHSEKEALDKWRRRAARVNFNDLIIIGMQQNIPSEHNIEDFDKLPFERKLYFVTKDMPDIKSAVYIPEFKDLEEVGDPYKKGHLFYKYLLADVMKSHCK